MTETKHATSELFRALEAALSCETSVLDPDDAGSLASILIEGPLAALLAERDRLRSQLSELREAARETEDSLHTIILSLGRGDWTSEETLNVLRGAVKKLRAAPIYEESDE
jgi:hypothetical protein